MEHTGNTKPTSTIQEMTGWLASDLGVDTEQIYAWTISIVIALPEGLGMINRMSDAQPDPYLVLGQIEAFCKAVTGSQDVPEDLPEDSGQG